LRIDDPSGSEGPKEVDYIRYDNPYEAYLNAQIRVDDALIPLLDEHIAFLEDDEDIDLVLESFEHNVYRVKKQIYTDVEDWEQLIDHLPEDRLEEIKNNPKGQGDLLIKELIWIRNYENKWMKK
jgi:bacterioferritin